MTARQMTNDELQLRAVISSTADAAKLALDDMKRRRDLGQEPVAYFFQGVIYVGPARTQKGIT